MPIDITIGIFYKKQRPQLGFAVVFICAKVIP
jgi:hypothetical protein